MAGGGAGGRGVRAGAELHGEGERGLRPLPREVVEAKRRALNLPPNYLLYLGTIEPRKNLRGLLHGRPDDRWVVIAHLVADAAALGARERDQQFLLS